MEFLTWSGYCALAYAINVEYIFPLYDKQNDNWISIILNLPCKFHGLDVLQCCRHIVIVLTTMKEIPDVHLLLFQKSQTRLSFILLN